MAIFTIHCDSPLHATRSDQPDWDNVLGTSDKPVVGYKCGACFRLDPPDQTIVRAKNKRDVEDKLRLAKVSNNQWLNRGQAPNNAAVVDQVDKLTRQVNALLKLALDDLDDTTGT